MALFASDMLSRKSKMKDDKNAPCQSNSQLSGRKLWVLHTLLSTLLTLDLMFLVPRNGVCSLGSKQMGFFHEIFWLKEKSLENPLDAKKKCSRSVILVGGIWYIRSIAPLGQVPCPCLGTAARGSAPWAGASQAYLCQAPGSWVWAGRASHLMASVPTGVSSQKLFPCCPSVPPETGTEGARPLFLPPALDLGWKPCTFAGQAGSGSAHFILQPSSLKKPDGGVCRREAVMHPFKV